MKIHSYESFGTVDGPGIRFIVFAQGCPLRCLYCHNPDTWTTAGSTIEATPAQVVAEVEKYRNFLKSGGITISGGEPLMQASEVADIFELCHSKGIHTALDTTGVILNDDTKRALTHTDLVLLDIKSTDGDMYKRIAGSVALDKTLAFLEYIQENNIKCWLRQVIVEGYTDSEEQLKALRSIADKYSVVEKVELLPYHDLAIPKYESLGIDYPLKGMAPYPADKMPQLRAIFEQ